MLPITVLFLNNFLRVKKHHPSSPYVDVHHLSGYYGEHAPVVKWISRVPPEATSLGNAKTEG